MTVTISEVRLAAPAGSAELLTDFYETRLGVPVADAAVRIGTSRLAFTETDGEPFYHFAFLVPGNRFEAAYAWLGERAPVLAGRAFDFEFLDARACYFHDPAQNIVELIAHRGIGDVPAATGDFSAAELIGISEIGLVTADMAGTAEALDARLGLSLWSGDVTPPDSLAFIGRQAHTLILAAPGRGWLPMGRPAEVHPVQVTLTGEKAGELRLPDHHVAVAVP